MPDLSVLLALLLGLILLVEGKADATTAVLGTLASVAVAASMTWMAGDRGERAARDSRPAAALGALRWARTWPLLGWIACLSFFDWGTWIANVVPREAWLGRYAVLFVPAVALWATSWAAQGRIEHAIATSQGFLSVPATGRRAIANGVRRNALALFPLLVLVGLLDGLWLLGELGVPGIRPVSRWIEAMPLLSVAVMLGLLALLSHFLPLFLRLFLPTEPLRPGRIRTLLEAQAKSIGLRYRDLVVWKTRGNVPNAMVVGYTPGMRTIFLTDGLLRYLPEDEILAVFCHEAGHAKRWHLPLLIGLFAIAALLFHVGGDLLMAHGVPWQLVLIAHLAVLWFVILGVISRFLEREADVYGAEHAADLDAAAESLYVPGLQAPLPAGAARMIRALERVRQVTGRSHSHRHGTIEQRVSYLAAYAIDPTVRARFARTRRRLLAGTALLGVIALLGAALRLPAEHTFARAMLAHEDGVEAYQEAFDLAGEDGSSERAATAWKEAAARFAAAARALGGQDDPRARQLRVYALYHQADVALRGLAEPARAREHYRAALRAMAASDLPAEAFAPLPFQIHVDLGRILAAEGDLEGALDELARANRTRDRASGPEGAYARARQALLEAAIEAAAGEVEAARTRLEDHVLRVAGGQDDEWIELRRDARAALEALPPPPPAPDAGD